VVVDEANLLCWQHSVQTERGGQKALMRHLRDDLGYDVVMEKYVATHIIGDLDFSNRVDLLINDKVIVECKHVPQLDKHNQEQLKKYMNHEKLRKDFGVLISFPRIATPSFYQLRLHTVSVMTKQGWHFSATRLALTCSQLDRLSTCTAKGMKRLQSVWVEVFR